MKKTKLFFRCMTVMGKRAPIYLLAILGMSVSFAMFSVMGSMLMKNVVDIAPSGEYKRLLWTVLFIVVGGFLCLILYRFCAITYNVEAKRVFGKLSGAVLDVELHLPYEYYEQHHSGELISKLSYDLNGMGAIYGSRFRRVVMPMLEVIVFLIPMMIYCPWLTICLVAVNGLILLSDMLSVKPIHKVKKQLSQINKTMTEHFSDMIQGMLTVRMFKAGLAQLDKINACNEKFYKKNKSQIVITSALESFTVGCDLLCALIFLLLGIYFVNKGFTTFGAVAAIYTMYGRFSKQFLMIGKYIPELSACLANADHIFEFLDEDREPDNWYKRVELVSRLQYNAIEVNDVSFAYNINQYVLKHFSLSISKNECVAITGPSGCGKTTLTKLILGLYPLEDGDIIIQGKSIKEVSLSDIRKNIAYVPQDAYLFSGTIKENIKYGMCSAADSDVWEAARLANAHGFISELSDGYDTVVHEGGTNLSGGQRQRIAIARAIISGAPIIILDEATSALDPESESKVNQALRNIQGKKTVVMIAHRPSTIQMADRVIRL